MPKVHRLRCTLAHGDDIALAGLLAELGWGDEGDAHHAGALLRNATWFALAEADGRLVG